MFFGHWNQWIRPILDVIPTVLYNDIGVRIHFFLGMCFLSILCDVQHNWWVVHSHWKDCFSRFAVWTKNMVLSTTMNGDKVSEVIVKFSKVFFLRIYREFNKQENRLPKEVLSLQEEQCLQSYRWIFPSSISSFPTLI